MKIQKPDELADGINFFTTPEGKVLFAEYYYGIPEKQEYTQIPIDEKKLKSILEFFEDYKLELDDSD